MYRLLLVTDKGDVRDLYRSYADWNQQGFEQPTIASGAEEGMAALSAQRFDVVSCLLPVEEAGILWDSVCFLFLLLQRRVFLSYYFLHVQAELRATALQASRCAAPL